MGRINTISHEPSFSQFKEETFKLGECSVAIEELEDAGLISCEYDVTAGGYIVKRIC
jgi:hypothetical protein